MMRLGDTSVPIPNTTIKTQAVDGTWWAAAWESRWSPESIYGSLAQLGEHLPYKQRVTGSSPVTSTFLLEKYPSG